MWTKSTGVIERISFGGTGVAGFSLSGPSDPPIWADLVFAQQQWVTNTLTKLNDIIVRQTGTTCPTWSTAITASSGCFQAWYNQNYVPVNPQAKKLRTDGIFDADTLCALQLIAGLNPQDFPTPFPDPQKKYCQAPMGAKKLSTGAMVGIAAGGAVVLGGIAYLVTRKPRRRR